MCNVYPPETGGAYPNYTEFTLFYEGNHRLAAKLHNKRRSAYGAFSGFTAVRSDRIGYHCVMHMVHIA